MTIYWSPRVPLSLSLSLSIYIYICCSHLLPLSLSSSLSPLYHSFPVIYLFFSSSFIMAERFERLDFGFWVLSLGLKGWILWWLLVWFFLVGYSGSVSVGLVCNGSSCDYGFWRFQLWLVALWLWCGFDLGLGLGLKGGFQFVPCVVVVASCGGWWLCSG